jgi:hypothetical protein
VLAKNAKMLARLSVRQLYLRLCGSLRWLPTIRSVRPPLADARISPDRLSFGHCSDVKDLEGSVLLLRNGLAAWRLGLCGEW